MKGQQKRLKKNRRKLKVMAKDKNQAVARCSTASVKATAQVTDNRFAPGELPRFGDVEPVAIRTITKLDQRSMVWAYDGVATNVEAISPFMSIVIGVGVVASLFFMWDLVFGADFSYDSIGIRIFLFVVSVVIVVGGSWFVYYMLKNSIFSAYGDLHFNRHSKTIYTAENNVSVRMNWANVRPFAVTSFGPAQFGAPIMMSLQLAEFASPNSNALVNSFIVAGPLPSRRGCQEVWELIRRYMEDPPERLPSLEVAQGDRDWVSVLLAFGPMSFGTIPQEFLAKLRERNWWPPINPFRVCFWIIGWYFPLSATLYNKYRRRAKLPAEWTKDEAPPNDEVNPYQTSARDPKEVAGRVRAAWIIGVVSGLSVAIGICLYGLVLMGMLAN
jgi:hypothetical protein